MTTKELEELLEGGIETPRIEYKGRCDWSVNLFAKGILAMANVEDGGRIIIGMEEKKGVGYERVGITKKEKSTFIYDNMRDQFASFASPHVKFSVDFACDKKGLEFAIITVDEFREVPVICIKASNAAGTKAPVIYYRNTDKKVESGPISNYHDLRDLLERSALKIRSRWKRLGVSAPDSVQKALDDELGNLR
ncbi:MAG: ATP-binding protein [Syntrophales bacterium]|jgi:predicted HTH transcriptional regulator